MRIQLSNGRIGWIQNSAHYTYEWDEENELWTVTGPLPNVKQEFFPGDELRPGTTVLPPENQDD